MSDINVITLTKFRADLARSLSRRADKIMESANLQEQVQALEPLEAYFLVKEVGLESALPILRAATPEQLQTFVDLDCWVGDAPDAIELDSWLSAFSTAGPEELSSAFLSLDGELQVWFLREALNVWEAEGEEQAPEPTRATRRMNTPDNMFVVDVKDEFDGEMDPLALLDALYRNDQDDAYRLLTATRWELSSNLVEEALRFRRGRVADLGFPERDEALRLFAPPPTKPRPPTIARHPATHTLPALYAAPLLDRSLLSRALGKVDDDALIVQLELDFLHLVNLAVVAFGESPREVGHVAQITVRVRDTVSLGLESLLGRPAVDEADEGQAAELVRTWSLSDLFRQGHQQSVPLQKRAGTMVRDPVVAAWLARAETESDDYAEDKRDRAFVQGLLRVPAVLAGTDPLAPQTAKAFASRADVDAAAARLERIRGKIS